MLASPNPDGRSNARRRSAVGQRPRHHAAGLAGMWIIDFGVDMPEAEAALYEAPFEYVRRVREAERATASRAATARAVVAPCEPAAGDAGGARAVSTGTSSPRRVSKHRLFVWLDAETSCPTAQLVAIARDDDYTFGVLHSRVHELWALAHGHPARESSRLPLHPHDLLRDLPVPAPHRRAARGDRGGRPPRSSTSATAGSTRPASTPAELAKRTLTNLYNAAPDLARATPTPPSTPPSSPPTAGPPTSPTTDLLDAAPRPQPGTRAGIGSTTEATEPTVVCP